MSKAHLITLSILLLSIFIGCGGNISTPVTAHSGQTFTAAQVFNPKVGDTWTFESFCNNAKQTTTVTIEAAPDNAAGTVGHHIILHFTKTDACAYWGITAAQAEDRFLMLELPEGGWRGVADIPTFPQSCTWCKGHTSVTLNWHPVPGMSIPYMIVPASITEGQITQIPTQYHMFELWDVNTTDDISSTGDDAGFINWETDFSVENVTTPIYSGLAVVSHQFEGCNEEKWYFAPNFGLVQIVPLGTCTAIDPNKIIKRIH